MLEVLAAATGVELGKFVLGQVLDLGKAALEDYVKDFFKDCIQSGVALANAETLKKPMAEAIGFFIKRFIKELQFNDVPNSSIEHHFKTTLKRFVRDKAVRPILGKAFEKDCKQIDYKQLQQIWTQQYQDNGWQFPSEEFDWRGVAKEYVVEVKGIIKADTELRSLLDTELLEEIARNTTQLSPGFDVAKYRESLQCSYGYLRLYTLDSTDRADTIKLWNMFIEQTVREALPPMRYELPLDLKRQLQEQGQLDDLSPEALEHYRNEYFQQPARKVLEAVAELQRAVILGDPGAGKSSLLQYLALDWVEGKAETLPLLIELREYVLAKSANFLEFLHCGRGADWQFDQQQLHQHLLENPTLVMFDGLDEVFDRPTQLAVIDDIIRFAQQYPQAKVLVTSRIIGYNPERFQHAGFRQFTIQPLDTSEVREFINRWYDLAMGSDSDKVRLKQRLKDAIDNSKAIANLADNPLLLTMMAILNRRQELPRDRTDLYDQASRVLLYHWDVDYKGLPRDAIGRREKQKMLRLIACDMQARQEGLKGNLIGVERLTRILTDYLHDEGFSEPREKANVLIQQLRERNFILCHRGADTYGFLHRTFLEYFCAVEIKERFNKRGVEGGISFEQLRDEFFGQHWQNEAWHEVLRLICGMIDLKFTCQLIQFLIDVFNSESKSLDPISSIRADSSLEIETEFNEEIDIVDCFNTNYNELAISIVRDIKSRETEKLILREICSTLVRDLIEIISKFYCCFSTLRPDGNEFYYYTVFNDIAFLGAGEQEIFKYLSTHAFYEGINEMCSAAVKSIVNNWSNDQEVINFLTEVINNHPFDTAFDPSVSSPIDSPRKTALQALLTRYPNHEVTLKALKNSSINDPDDHVRAYSISSLAKLPEVGNDILDLLRDRAINDPEEKLREWAQQQLDRLEQS